MIIIISYHFRHGIDIWMSSHWTSTAIFASYVYVYIYYLSWYTWNLVNRLHQKRKNKTYEYRLYMLYFIATLIYVCMRHFFDRFRDRMNWKKTKSTFLFKEKKTTMNIHIPNRNDTPDNTPLWCVYYMFYVSSLNRYDFINSHLCNKNAILSVVCHTKWLGRTNEECVIMKVSKQFY